MLDTAWAQLGSGGGAGGLLPSLLPLGLVFLIFYFLLIRPQQKQAKEHKKMIESLKRNDEVITSGGMYGRIISLTDTIVTIEVAPNVRVRFQRGQIATLLKARKGGDEKETGKETKD